jgi:hypothetical protein
MEVESGDQHWYVDTLDARGGLAFASWRAADSKEDTALRDRPVFHFSPPAFAPIPIASPAPALAAERYGFQLGLFDADGEVPFGSLDEVAEFVRRIYIGTGRSDGTSGGEGVPAPPPEGEPPDLPSEPLRGDADEGPLRKGLRRLEKAIMLTSRGTATEISWSTGLREKTHSHKRSSQVAIGGVLTLVETLARFPGSGSEEKLEIWLATASRLVATCCRLGVVQFLESGVYPFVESACRQFLKSAGPVLINHPRHNYLNSVWEALALMADFDPGYEYWLRRVLEVRGSAPGAEPFEDLSRFPIAHKYAVAIAAPEPARASIADLLSSILASPTRIKASPNIDAIAMFAAARIVSFDGASPVIGDSYSAHHHPQRLEARLAQREARAYDWLSRELPRFAFSYPVEELINKGVPDKPLFGPRSGQSAPLRAPHRSHRLRGARAIRRPHR